MEHSSYVSQPEGKFCMYLTVDGLVTKDVAAPNILSVLGITLGCGKFLWFLFGDNLLFNKPLYHD